AVAFSNAGTPPALFRHDAAELVAEHDGRGYGPALRSVVLMHVAAADAHRADLQQHLVFADLGDRSFAQLHRTRLQIELHYGGHCFAHCLILLVISLNIDFKSAPATLNECASIASGAPITTSGAPCFGIEIASSIDRPPTACTGRLTASTTAFRSSSGLRRLPVSAKTPFRSSKPV